MPEARNPMWPMGVKVRESAVPSRRGGRSSRGECRALLLASVTPAYAAGPKQAGDRGGEARGFGISMTGHAALDP